MKNLVHRLVATAALLLPLYAGAFGSVVIFGDSLSDSGNNALVLGTDPNQVITDNSYVPTLPYGSGTYSDGDVWSTSFAAGLGLTALPSRAGGSNYAYGGALTGNITLFPPSLKRQLVSYLGSTPTDVADTLFVIAGGGNNARAALDNIAGGAPPLLTIALAARRYANDIGTMVDTLQAAGALNIVVWDTPDIGLSPAAIAGGGGALGTTISARMNDALNARLAGEAGVDLFSVFGLVNAVVADPAGYGLANVGDACGAILGCDASTYLFWDGVHPTSAGHAILSDAMLSQFGTMMVPVPEPSGALLLAAGLLALAWRRQSARSSRSTSAASL